MKQPVTRPFVRISENEFKTHKVESSNYEAIINRADSGDFSLSLFGIRQILAGATVDATFVAKTSVLTKVLSTLGLYALDVVSTEEIVTFPMLREDVECMKELLEARMRHCEHERDQKSDRFNPDTYISQKLLLLDIREWLMVYSMEIVRRSERTIS